MARAEQKYLIDSEALEHLLAMMRDGIARGVNDQELLEQTREILDPEYRAKTNQALKERAEGKVRRFKNAEEMVKDLRSH